VTFADFDRFCASLPSATLVVQWGGSHVWKVGGKVFAIGVLEESGPAFTFKVTQFAYEIMRAEPGVRPAPYLAARGMTWLQRTDATSLSDDDLRRYLKQSYELVVAGLTRKARAALTPASAAPVPSAHVLRLRKGDC
jgi:predicted DNA-binding protein (MmcQ/YjbR family)